MVKFIDAFRKYYRSTREASLLKMNGIGRIFFAVGLAGLGVLSIIYRGFALVWQPMPEPFPHRELLGVLSGSVLLVGGVCMLFPRSGRSATLAMAIYVSSWPALQIPFNLWRNPLSASMWTALAETVMLISGGYILFRSNIHDRSDTENNIASTDYFNRALQLAFAFALPVISISHFVYAFSKSPRTPPWIPFYVAFAFLTGVAHTAAGIGIISRIAARLAASLEAIMIGLFALILHVPLIVLQPTNRLFWTALFIATACSGASFIVASSIPRRKTRFCAPPSPVL